MSRRVIVSFVLLFGVGIGSSARAQAPTAETAEELRQLQKVPGEDELAWTASAGGTLNTGNTKQWNTNAATTFRYASRYHLVDATAQFNYGRAVLLDAPEEGFRDTVRKFSSRARYGYHLTHYDALFVGTGFRWDTFAGLEARVQGQAGYLRYFLRADAHRLWGEVGYDFTYDNFYPNPLRDEMGFILPGSRRVHSGRVFLGYENRLNAAVSFLTGAEVLVSILQPENTRLRWDNALTSQLVDRFAVELRFLLEYENLPPAGRVKLDTTTLVNLVVTLI